MSEIEVVCAVQVDLQDVVPEVEEVEVNCNITVEVVAPLVITESIEV